MPVYPARPIASLARICTARQWRSLYSTAISAACKIRPIAREIKLIIGRNGETEAKNRGERISKLGFSTYKTDRKPYPLCFSLLGLCWLSATTDQPPWTTCSVRHVKGSPITETSSQLAACTQHLSSSLPPNLLLSHRLNTAATRQHRFEPHCTTPHATIRILSSPF